MALPVAGGPLAFPLVQRCATGTLEWIEDTVPGQPEPEHPAPILQVTQGVAATTTTEAPTTTAEPSTTITAPTTTAPTATTAPADGDDGSGSSPLPYVAGGLAGVAVIGGGAYALARSRRNATP
jgi:hypothetical protein